MWIQLFVYALRLTETEACLHLTQMYSEDTFAKIY